MKELKSKLFELSRKSRIVYSLYSKASEIKTKRYSSLSDEKYIKMMFKKSTGKDLNLENPIGFNEKIQWLKLYNRRPEYTVMVDKVLAKEYVSERIGERYVIPTLGVWDSPDEIDFQRLPNCFVLKCNHNSGGGMCICTDKAKLNIKKTNKDLKKGLKSDSFLASREWPYKNVKRKILAEVYMTDGITECLIDYKFYCFNGTPKFLYVALANYHDGKKNDELSYYNLDWSPTEFYRTDHKPFPLSISKPEKLSEMINIASELSKGIPFVRVDLYYIKGEIYFSEFTFSPGGGFNEFKPYEWEKRIGSWIDLSLVEKLEQDGLSK